MINRHTERCNRDRVRHTQSSMSTGPFRCECGVDACDPHWYEKKLDICFKLRLAFTHCQHHKEFTKRLDKYFRNALIDYSVSVSPSKEVYKPDEINVWGCGLLFEEAVSIRWYMATSSGSSDGRFASWQEGFKDALAREEQSLRESIATIERENDALITALEKMDAAIETAIIQARKFAPNPSSDLAKHFPLIFKTDVKE